MRANTRPTTEKAAPNGLQHEQCAQSRHSRIQLPQSTICILSLLVVLVHTPPSQSLISTMSTFLFTSESVNEGHPGACVCVWMEGGSLGDRLHPCGSECRSVVWSFGRSNVLSSVLRACDGLSLSLSLTFINSLFFLLQCLAIIQTSSVTKSRMLSWMLALPETKCRALPAKLAAKRAWS